MKCTIETEVEASRLVRATIAALDAAVRSGRIGWADQGLIDELQVAAATLRLACRRAAEVKGTAGDMDWKSISVSMASDPGPATMGFKTVSPTPPTGPPMPW